MSQCNYKHLLTQIATLPLKLEHNYTMVIKMYYTCIVQHTYTLLEQHI